MAKLYNLARMSTATTGTGTITLGSAVTINGVTYLSFAAAGVVDGDVVSYGIADANASEVGYGTYTASGTTLTRNVSSSTNSNSAINLSGAAQVFIMPRAQDFYGLDTIASASTTDLDAGTTHGAPCVTVSGVVTITSFGSSAPTGAVKKVQFSGILTLTHNASSLIVPGGASITTAAGDCLIARHEGSGNWRVLFYQRASGKAVTGPASTDITDSTATGRSGLTAADALAFLNVGAAAPQCGILAVNSTTQIAFAPKNGDLVKVAGTLYRIPSGAVTAANTSVYVNGSSGQNLAASTAYLVCLFNNSGTLTVDFISTLTHQFDGTAGNVGVEIKNGDTTRTVIGMIRTDASSHFLDNTTNRHCLSWFNKSSKTCSASTGNVGTSSNTEVALGANLVSALNWANDPVGGVLIGQWSTTGTFADLLLGRDGTTAHGTSTFAFGATPSGSGFSVTVGGDDNPSEGYHTYGAVGAADSGSGTATLTNGFFIVTVLG